MATIRASRTTAFSSTVSSTYVVNLPNDVAANDMLLVVIAMDRNSSGATFSTPSGWTKIGDSDVNRGGWHIREVFRKTTVTGTEDNGTVTFTANLAGSAVAMAFSIFGHSGPVSIQTALEANSTGTTADPGSYASPYAEYLGFSFVTAIDDDAAISAYPADLTYHTASVSSGAGANVGITMGVAVVGSTAATFEPTGNFTISTSQDWATFSMLVQSEGFEPPPDPPDPPVFGADFPRTAARAVFVAEGEVSVMDGTWSTATDSSCRLLLDAIALDGLTETEINALVTGDLYEAYFPGYSAAALTSANWTITPGTPTTAEHAEVTFTASSDPSFSVVVEGYFVTRDSDDQLIYFEIFDGGPYRIEAAGDELSFTPGFTVRGVGQ